MVNELDDKKYTIMKTIASIEHCPTTQDVNLSLEKTTKMSLSNISAFGVAFEPLTSAIQTAINGGGGSGIYYVNTNGKSMFQQTGSNKYIGSLKTSSGNVGGGQANMTPLACDPTMLFMAAALMNIEKKLDAILETQQEILQFLEQKEIAKLKGNLNILTDVLNNYKFNWNNEKYKTNKYIQVQEIKRDAEHSILLYRNQIAKKTKKRSLIHSDQEVKGALKKLQDMFKDYQLALYLYSFSSFLEVMLLENFDSAYLNSVSSRIEEYSYQYRILYTESYNLMESYSNSSIQSGLFSSISVASKAMGKVISKVPVISKSQLDENLMEASTKLKTHSSNRTNKTLEEFLNAQSSVVIPFVESIKTVNRLYNKSTEYLFDKENIYVCQLEE